ncbi:hypothetical protein [Ralstonia pseudosolanacearum]|uniref:hypothetical protein n=1 Tax=Ralstonia pseudosolanacearum TaxID=1310165 RepID=UPI00223445CF|nr:hypothetical protein [Ralstonia sp. RS647]UZF35813.1 hypothetical protein LGV81_03785 [Ralstonia sp. RS647]
MMLQRFAVALREIGGGKLMLQGVYSVTECLGQRIGRRGPVHHETRRQYMGLHELVQRTRRDMPQKMPGIENLHCDNPTCCSEYTRLAANGRRY